MPRRSPEIVNKTPNIYGIHNRVVVSDDVVMIDERVQRYVQTKETSPVNIAYRQALIQQGLVLGERIYNGADRGGYLIPVTSRPLALEMGTSNEDESVYTDADLIYDMGELAGKVARTCGNRIITGPAAEDAFALTDYAYENQRQLFLTPGVEHLLSPPVNGDTGVVMDAQMTQFSAAFGERFGEHVPSFIQGFSDGLVEAA